MRLHYTVPVLLALAACASPMTTPDAALDATANDTAVVPDTAPADTAATDTAPPVDAAVDAPADVPAADSNVSGCGTARPDLATNGAEGLVIGRDGMIYFAESGAVSRVHPDGTTDSPWVTLPAAASTVWGLALDHANHRLWVGSPSSHAVYLIDPTAATPTATVWLANAGQPNGLTTGPDDALYYSDFGGNQVYRSAAMGTKTAVTTTAIPQANGLEFGADGRLYVLGYGDGHLYALTLTNNAETARATIAMGLTAADGLSIDSMGRFWVGLNSSGAVVRVNADGTGRTTIFTPGSSTANIEFGTGALNCSDVYVATGNNGVVRYEMNTVTGAMVPWH